ARGAGRIALPGGLRSGGLDAVAVVAVFELGVRKRAIATRIPELIAPRVTDDTPRFERRFDVRRSNNDFFHVSLLLGALLPLTLSSLRIPETGASPLGHFFDRFLEPHEITRVFRARPAPHPPPSSAAAPRRAPPQHSGAARVHRRAPTPAPRTPARRSEVAARRREPQPHREPRHAGHGA